MFEVSYSHHEDNLFSLSFTVFFWNGSERTSLRTRDKTFYTRHTFSLLPSFLFHCFVTFHSSFLPSLSGFFGSRSVLGFSPEPRLFESLPFAWQHSSHVTYLHWTLLSFFYRFIVIIKNNNDTNFGLTLLLFLFLLLTFIPLTFHSTHFSPFFHDPFFLVCQKMCKSTLR